MNGHILILNSGSSSLKFSVFDCDKDLSLVGSGSLAGIRTDDGRFSADWNHKRTVDDVSFENHEKALAHLLGYLEDKLDPDRLISVGHRLVHGGTKFVKPLLIDDSVVAQLEQLSRFAPLHLPPALSTVKSARLKFSTAKHIACFDTSFHRTMPMVAKVLPISKSLFDEGVEKFGFHGLSYEFVVSELPRFGRQMAEGKVLIAHLGNGCSIVALDGGKSVDTTMGFSPAGGLVMGTRTGDIDPGLVSYFASEKGVSADQFVKLVNKESGLLGLSGISSDMQELLEEEQSSSDARLAIDIFCYHVRKHIGALSAVLGGLDALVFTGGIGENSSSIRSRICQPLGYLGIELDNGLNESVNGSKEISWQGARTKTFVVKTNEEMMIATHCLALIQGH
ncbi:MAG: acetate/propionate family kinase [Candidatus Obscuribacterales bacterium]|nr:acetate/propionate family kinase [Candidatus Obscuribacterales bacterium]